MVTDVPLPAITTVFWGLEDPAVAAPEVPENTQAAVRPG